MSGPAVTSWFMALAWFAATITAAVMVSAEIEEAASPGPERDEAGATILTMVWTIGLLFTLGYAGAGVGLSLDHPWGKAMAWIMMPWTILLVVPGLPIGIYQMVALPRQP